MQNNEFKCAVKHFLDNDLVIHTLIKKYGIIELKRRRKYFAALVTSIIGQQLSVSSARAIINRFNIYFLNDLDPERILKEKDQKLRSLGLSRAKTIYVKDLSSKLINGEITLKGIGQKSNSEIMDELKKVKGIGEWTVHMFLIFVLGRPNILPKGDLGIKKAIMLNYNLKNIPSSEEVIKISKNNGWEPFTSYASLYLWKSIDGN